MTGSLWDLKRKAGYLDGLINFSSSNFSTVKNKIVLIAVLIISNSVFSQTVTLKQIGKNNMLFNKFAYHYRGNLYTIDINLALYKTSLDSGNTSRIGKVTFKNAKFFFIVNNMVYIIERDGSMTQVDPVTGNWTVVSRITSWSRIDWAFAVNNTFYTVQNGALFRQSLVDPDKRTQVGGNDFFSLGYIFLTERSFHTLYKDGTLYEINTTTGEWKKLFKNKSIKNLMEGFVWNNKFYTAEDPGGLFEHDLSSGERKSLSAPQFSNVVYMFVDSGKLYALFKDGNLYEVTIN